MASNFEEASGTTSELISYVLVLKFRAVKLENPFYVCKRHVKHELHHGIGLFNSNGFICVLLFILEQYGLSACNGSAIGFPVGKNTGCL